MIMTRARFHLSLLCLALPLAACSGDDAATGSATATTSTGSTGTSSSETTSTSTTGETSGSGSDSASTSTSTSTSTTGDPTTSTTGDPTSTTGDPTTTGGIDDPLCEEFCAHLVACGAPADPACLGDCSEITGLFHGIGPICSDAIDAFFGCANGLECAELGALLNDEPSPCDDAAAEVNGDPPACILKEEPPAFCVDFCTKAEECKLGEPTCLEDCSLGYHFGNGQDPACGAAVEAYYTCLGALDCDNLQNPVTCLDEATEVEAVCNF